MTIDELLAESFRISSEKGWIALDKRPAEDIALMHSEVSEAWECLFGGETETVIEDGKPEGFGIELMDVVIRIATFYGQHGIGAPEGCGSQGIVAFSRAAKRLRSDAEEDCLLDIHGALTRALEGVRHSDPAATECCLWNALTLAVLLATRENYNVPELLRLKLAYNATRPHLHGGKAL